MKQEGTKIKRKKYQDNFQPVFAKYLLYDVAVAIKKLKNNKMRNDLECPYCGKGLEINHEDGFGYEEDVPHQMQCEHCEKEFVFYTSISFYYEPYKADCLNNGKHIWKPQICFPKECTEMQCESCGDVREPTKKEMASILDGRAVSSC